MSEQNLEGLSRTKDNGDELDQKWGDSAVLDWVLVAMPDWASGPPKTLLSEHLYRDTTYTKIKSIWATWPNPCNIRPATPEEVSIDNERRFQTARLVAEKEKAAEAERERLRSEKDHRKAERERQRKAALDEFLARPSPGAPDEAAIERTRKRLDGLRSASFISQVKADIDSLFESITKVIGFLVIGAVGLAVPVLLVYGFVQFIKWCWYH